MKYYNTGNMPYTQFIPPCMYMQGQYIMPQMPQLFQDVIEGDFLQWPAPVPGYSMDTMDGQAMPYNLTMSSPGMPVSPGDLQTTLELIKEAIGGETEDRLFYEYLIGAAPSEEDKNIIKEIRDNEIKHFDMFRELYKELTGQMIPCITEGEFVKPSSFCEGLKTAIMGEQKAVEKYRKILFALSRRDQINKMIEIITDELRHGILYNYLYSKNKCTE